ncbi:MAG: hypothetical protein E7212_14680 [Clostridium sartagoforme]|nr:hypothetical protein [Clostridium sartagoforme]
MFQEKYRKENLIIVLFILIVIISQGIRGYLNSLIGSSIFNYHVIPISLITLMVLIKTNRFSKSNFIVFLSISGLIIMGFLLNRYSFSDFIRTVVGFILPLLILLIDHRDMDIKYVFTKIVKYFNVYIYITFIIQLVISIRVGRTGGIVGHPLTSGWYYAIFISFNIIYYKFFRTKSDLLIIIDSGIALVGTVLASGRISMFTVIILSIIYSFCCCKRRSITYLILPVFIIVFLSTPVVDEYIWSKFRDTASWGDISNGRLLGIREMMFFSKYPNFFIGRGIGYSNYVSQYVFGVVNFENPILMFSYDYGIIGTLLLITLILINPIFRFINKKNYLLTAIYSCVLIIPFTYNGLAETVGIFIVLIFIIYIFSCLDYYIMRIKSYRV